MEFTLKILKTFKEYRQTNHIAMSIITIIKDIKYMESCQIVQPTSLIVPPLLLFKFHKMHTHNIFKELRMLWSSGKTKRPRICKYIISSNRNKLLLRHLHVWRAAVCLHNNLSMFYSTMDITLCTSTYLKNKQITIRPRMQSTASQFFKLLHHIYKITL